MRIGRNLKLNATAILRYRSIVGIKYFCSDLIDPSDVLDFFSTLELLFAQGYQ